MGCKAFLGTKPFDAWGTLACNWGQTWLLRESGHGTLVQAATCPRGFRIEIDNSLNPKSDYCKPGMELSTTRP